MGNTWLANLHLVPSGFGKLEKNMELDLDFSRSGKCMESDNFRKYHGKSMEFLQRTSVSNVLYLSQIAPYVSRVESGINTEIFTPCMGHQSVITDEFSMHSIGRKFRSVY